MSTALSKQLTKKRGKFCPEVGGGATAPGGGKATHIMPAGDIRRVPGQNFLVFSYATPDGTTRVRSPRGMVMKFSGAFPDEKRAGEHAELVRNEDPRFDVFVIDMYKWGMVPLPDDEKPFVTRKYADEMLTRIVSGLQNSMEQGKKEMEERKERDRKRAEDAMRRATGRADYEMPEKSDILLGYEDEVKEKRAAAGKEAEEAGESAAARIMHSEQDVMNVLMQYCVERVGCVIDAGTGADLMKFFVEKSIERDAQMMRAVEREKPDEDPSTLPSAAEVKEKGDTRGIDLTEPQQS